jgi:V-type H+-transporting ATPase subunit C
MQTSADSTWFISAPANPTKQDTITKLRERITDCADIYPFQLPEFKVGTLDSLMVISDELVKSDQFIESVVLKMADALRTFMKSPEEWKVNLKVGKGTFI